MPQLGQGSEALRVRQVARVKRDMAELFGPFDVTAIKGPCHDVDAQVAQLFQFGQGAVVLDAPEIVRFPQDEVTQANGQRWEATRLASGAVAADRDAHLLGIKVLK